MFNFARRPKSSRCRATTRARKARQSYYNYLQTTKNQQAMKGHIDPLAVGVGCSKVREE